MNEDLVRLIFEYDDDDDEARAPCIGKTWHRVRRGPSWLLKTRSAVYTVSFSPDGSTIAVGGFRGTAALYHVRTRMRVRDFSKHTSLSSTVNIVRFSPDGSTLALATVWISTS